MCKTYDAIYELSKHTESDILICSLGNLKIEGQLYKCCKEMGHEKCYEGIVTLKDAIVRWHEGEYRKEYKWLNIPSKHIKAFAFKCCEM